MNGQWKEVTEAPPHGEGFSRGGLLIVYAYHGETGSFAPNHFEVWHEASGEFMLEVNASLERTQEIATNLASIADWAALSTTDEMMLQARLMAFGTGYPGEVVVYNDWVNVAELDQIVPFGSH